MDLTSRPGVWAKALHELYYGKVGKENSQKVSPLRPITIEGKRRTRANGNFNEPAAAIAQLKKNRATGNASTPISKVNQQTNKSSDTPTVLNRKFKHKSR